MRQLGEAALKEAPYGTAKTQITRANILYLVGLNLLMAAGFHASKKLGTAIAAADVTEDGTPRPSSCGTPVMFGNNGRAPLFPAEREPFHLDYEERQAWTRKMDKRQTELILKYHTFLYHSFYHEAREDADDQTIYTAEHHADILKRLNEQRHEMAIKCV